MPTLHIDGEAFSYMLEGPAGAPVLMFSNSLGTTMDLWEGQAAALRQRYRVLRYDTRGHGGSAIPDAPGTLAQLGRDALALIDALELETVSFCGISMGGMIGLWLGIHAGHRLQRLVIANSAARIGSGEAWRARAAQVAAAGMDAVADGAAGRWFTPDFMVRDPAQAKALVDGLRDGSPAGYGACCLALADADLRAQIALISVPTLLIAGRDDPVTTVADMRFLQAGIQGSRLVELPASHLSNVEAGGEFTRHVGEFLA